MPPVQVIKLRPTAAFLRTQEAKRHPVSEVTEFRVNIRTLTGKIFSTYVRSDDTMGALKARINDSQGIPGDQQRLIVKGTELPRDDSALVIAAQGLVKDESGVERLETLVTPEATLHLILRMRGGMYHSTSGHAGLNLNFVYILVIKDVNHILELNAETKVAQLLDMIFDLLKDSSTTADKDEFLENGLSRITLCVRNTPLTMESEASTLREIGFSGAIPLEERMLTLQIC